MPSYVIVGASRGLGYAWLQNLARDKENTVIGLARSPDAVSQQLAADKIENVHMIQADMTDHVSLASAAEKISQLTPDGGVDYFIVNGAYMNPKADALTPMAFSGQEELLKREMTAHLSVNVVGVILAINAFLPLVRKGSVKKIVVLSTGLADFEFVKGAEIPTHVAYGAVRAALNMVVLKYGVELKGEGVVVLALSPGLVDTRMDKPSEAEMAGFKVMMQKFQTLYPNFTGPITPEESVKMQKKVIENLTIKDSGEFLSHRGTKEWL